MKLRKTEELAVGQINKWIEGQTDQISRQTITNIDKCECTEAEMRQRTQKQIEGQKDNKIAETANFESRKSFKCIKLQLINYML